MQVSGLNNYSLLLSSALSKSTLSSGSSSTSGSTSGGTSDQVTLSSQAQSLLTNDQASGTTSSNDNVHDMTNAQLVAYANSHGLTNIADSFQVDYTPVDRSAAGESSAYQSLMSDPTKHDFVAQYEEAAQWQLQHGSASGGQYFQSMSDELIAASANDASTQKV